MPILKGSQVEVEIKRFILERQKLPSYSRRAKNVNNPRKTSCRNDFHEISVRMFDLREMSLKKFLTSSESF